MDFDQFDLNDPKQVFDKLVKQALSGKHSDFEFVRNLGMLRVVRLYKRGVRRVSRLFGNMARDLLEQYADKIVSSMQDVEALLAVKRFEVCHDYYEKEVEIAKDMISEYKAYVASGHRIDALLGKYRPDDECVDYRKLPFKLF